MTTISVDELEQHLREVLERVRNGEHVLIASNGETVAEISPCLESWEVELGIRRAVLPMKGFEIPAIPVEGPVDSVELIRAERQRDRLP